MDTSGRVGYIIRRRLQVDFYECAHTQCFCKRSGGAYDRIRGMCYSSRSRTDVLTARFRKSHTPPATLHRRCHCLYHYVWAAAARTVAGTAFLAIKVRRPRGNFMKIGTRPSYHTCGITTLCPSYNNIILLYCTVYCRSNAARSEYINIINIHYYSVCVCVMLYIYI